MASIPVSQLLEDKGTDLRLSVVAGRAGLERPIGYDRVQKPGLVLAGHTASVHPERVQVFGNTEMSFLATLPPERAAEVLARYLELEIACLVITKGLEPPAVLVELAERAGVPLLQSTMLSSRLIAEIEGYLTDALTPTTSLHGVLMDVLGVGVLLLGKSGIGKSECALDLVLRGHRLVADDIVDIKRRGPDSVVGYGSALIKHHMEIRGIGIINIKDLFGVAAVRDRKKIEMVIELVEWDDRAEYDRLGLEERAFVILDVPVPLLVVPIRPGRNMTTLIEVAARNHLLKLQGHHSARDFQDRLNRLLAGAQRGRRALGGEVE